MKTQENRMPDNYTLAHQLAHRTIRAFKPEPLTDDTVKTLFEVARWTATSSAMQASSIINVTDPNLKAQVAQICNQPYVAHAPLLLIFIVDQYRNDAITRAVGHPVDTTGLPSRFFQAFTDACITAQNVVNAAESMGLGTCYLGSILNDIPQLVQALKLPKLTFPVVGLMVGHPDQEPGQRPRMDNSLRVFENNYTVFDDYAQAIADYDAICETYYRQRDPKFDSPTFSAQLVKRLSAGNPRRELILDFLRAQGFSLPERADD
jgi:nitroreductase